MESLSKALNKAGICQEIDFKRSDYSDECSVRHTNHSSIWPPRASYRDCTRRGKLTIRVARVWRGRACNVLMTGCCNSARLVGSLALASMVRVTSDHKFSIAFIPGDTAGYSMCSIPSVSMKLTTVRALWGLTLSSWYTKLYPNIRRVNSNNVSSRICRCWYWSRFPSTIWRSQFPPWWKAPHMVIPPSPAWIIGTM